MVYLPGRLRHRVPRRVQHRDDGAHGGVNIAEDAHDAGVLERHALRGARRVQADIERLAAEIGKRVVKDQVEIRKVHRAAQRRWPPRAAGTACPSAASPRAWAAGRAPARSTGSSQSTTPAVVLVLAHRGILGIGQFHLARDECAAAPRPRPTLKQISQRQIIVVVDSHSLPNDTWCAPAKLPAPPAHSAPRGSKRCRQTAGSCRSRPCPDRGWRRPPAR